MVNIGSMFNSHVETNGTPITAKQKIFEHKAKQDDRNYHSDRFGKAD